MNSLKQMAAWPMLLVPLHLAFAADLEISRPARSWEFMDAVGPRAAVFGTENGVVEAWVYPLKILKDLQLEFNIDGHTVPATTIARRIVSRPGSYSIVYASDEFRVVETFAVPMDQPGVVIRLEIESSSPVDINVRFRRDFQLMWPASMGTPHLEWNAELNGFTFGADGQTYAALIASPGAKLTSREYATDFGSSSGNSFSLGSMKGKQTRSIVIAASLTSREEMLAAYRKLSGDPGGAIRKTETFYNDYLSKTIKLDLPDKNIQAAYDWSRLSMRQGLVENPLLGPGLVAGYGPSKGTYRPGYAWFFGRDSCWTSFALTAQGDFSTARAALAFIAKFQREDGKMPHEISQSASLVPWFEKLPYGFASADATPLFIIAVRDYVEASGDFAFLKENWIRLQKAMAFMRSTFAADGFPKNIGVGHGWVEGGPLLPIRTEFYYAGLAVEAGRSLAILAREMGDPVMKTHLEEEYKAKRKLLNEKFWIAGSKSYAFGLNEQDKPVDQPSVLATVPMWFDLLDRDHSRDMIATLANEAHSSDWGMRIIGTASSLYHPAGYHFGSVWPLFTGWASVGEYRSHLAHTAFSNLQANAWLALDGAAGGTTEVLSGATYSPLSTSSPHQVWSAAMVVSPILRGMLGFETDVLNQRLRLSPHLPADWNYFELKGAKVDLLFRNEEHRSTLRIVNRGTETVEVEFAPALAICQKVIGADFNGKAIKWTREEGVTDWHPHFTILATRGQTSLTIRHKNAFGFSVPSSPPALGAFSSNLKVISENWSNAGKDLELTVSGISSALYRINLFGDARIASVNGGAFNPAGNYLAITMPPGSAEAYQKRAVKLRFK